MKPAVLLSFSLLIFISLFGCASTSLQDNRLAGENIITPDLMKKHIFTLASDSMMGRDTPSRQLDSAASYIAEIFKSSGLQPVNGSYYQKVGLGIVSLGEDNYLKITKDNSEQSYKIKSEFTPFDLTGNKEANGSILFAGYGITAPDYKYDDYKDIDAKGKIVLVLKHEPQENDSNSVFKGIDETQYSNISEKVKNAIEHGALGVLVVTEPLNHTSLTPRGFPWPSLSKTLPKDALPMVLIDETEKRVPVVQIGEEVISKLFGSVDELKNIQSKIDNTLQQHSFEIKDALISLKTTTTIEDKSSQNVIGYIEGSDPKLKNEVVIIGGHYDHVGYMKQHTDTVDYIFNGADDNASGTSTVMAVAQAFSTIGQKPKRSVIFIAFTGEEKGLMGSRSYVNKPIFPLDETVAMLNIDMVGRNGDDTLWMVGEALCPELAKINEEENKEIGFTLLDEESLQGGSDHMYFQKKNIPFLFYHSGLHSDLHKVSDNPEFINTNKAARAAQLVFRTAWRIANEGRRYKLIDSKTLF
ncbi:MAG: M28 family peptidase [Ignavibacteriales bacterium]|nr:M28 family peptidase [Ignavibacteriales bacterium]